MTATKFNLNQRKEILLCCLEALNSFNSTFPLLIRLYLPLHHTPISNKKIIAVPDIPLIYNDFSYTLPLAKNLVLLASGHINQDQRPIQQYLLSQYLYKFRYFYKQFYFEQSKGHNYLQPNMKPNEINNVAIWAVFQLVKY